MLFICSCSFSTKRVLLPLGKIKKYEWHSLCRRGQCHSFLRENPLDINKQICYNVVRCKQRIGMSPSGKARDFDSRIRQFKSGHPSQKSESHGFRIFHLCRRHNIICVAHATSFERQLNFIAARAAQMNDVAFGK